MTTPFPTKDSLRICFAHVAYALHDTLQKAQHRHITAFQVWDYDSLVAKGDRTSIYWLSPASGSDDILGKRPQPPFHPVHWRRLRPVPVGRAS